MFSVFSLPSVLYGLRGSSMFIISLMFKRYLVLSSSGQYLFMTEFCRYFKFPLKSPLENNFHVSFLAKFVKLSRYQLVEFKPPQFTCSSMLIISPMFKRYLARSSSGQNFVDIPSSL
jgi:hypothetical protein